MRICRKYIYDYKVAIICQKTHIRQESISKTCKIKQLLRQ